MNADDRILLLDLENLGAATLRPRPLRVRLEALLAAGSEHHAVAACAVAEDAPDPVASLLAELRIAPLRALPDRTSPSWRFLRTPDTAMPRAAGSS